MIKQNLMVHKISRIERSGENKNEGFLSRIGLQFS